MPDKKAVIVLSGGMDSTTLLHYIVKENNLDYNNIYVLSFKYGQRHDKELECARAQVAAIAAHVAVIDHRIIDISFFGELTKDVSALTGNIIKVPHIKDVVGDPQPVTYVPFRNLMFLSIALAYAENVGANKVFYGAQKHDTYSGYFDATEEFRQRLNHVAALNRRHQIIIEAPFVDMSKSELLEWGLTNGVDYANTWTCYNGGEHPCGICPTCSDRIQSFMSIGEQDPLLYKKPDPWGRV